MVYSGGVNVVPGIDIVAKIDLENEVITVEINGEVVYDSSGE